VANGVDRAQAVGRTGDPDRPDRHAAPVDDRRRARHLVDDQLAHIGGPAAVADLLELACEPVGIGDRRPCERPQPVVGDLAGDVSVVGEEDLAERRGVRGEQRAHLQGLAAVVGPEDVMDHEHAVLMQRPDADAFVRARGQRVGPVQGARAQLVPVQIAGAHVQQGRAELVLPRLGVLLDEPDVHERPQDPVHGRLRQAQLTGEIGDSQSRRAAREQPQDCGRTLDGLDRLWHRFAVLNRADSLAKKSMNGV